MVAKPEVAAAARPGCARAARPTVCRIGWWRRDVWRLERDLGRPLSRTSHVERRSSDPALLDWTRLLWKGRARRLQPAWDSWLRDALCVHSREGSWTDPGAPYYGGMQFDVATWLSNGGGRYSRTADLASPLDQLRVAHATWQRRGWTPWPATAAACGLL